MSNIYMEYLTESEREELILEKEQEINSLKEEMKTYIESFVSCEGTKSIDKKTILKYYFLDNYDSKYDNMYNQRCDDWDEGFKPTKSYNISGIAQFYYMDYSVNDIIKLAKNNIDGVYHDIYDNGRRVKIGDNEYKDPTDPRFDNKTLGSVFENGGGDCILYCLENEKFYLYLHEKAIPIVASLSYKEFMNLSKSQIMKNPIYKKRYKEKQNKK